MIDVDGDQSTNDTVLILANGASEPTEITKVSSAASSFKEALNYVATELAKELVRDGEGAQTLIEVSVNGSKSKDDARKALSQILLNPNTYFEHSVPVDCGFRPGIAFRFSDGIIEVDVLVCFSCRELRYYSAGKLVGESHFQSPEILALTKKLFPDDKIIQALK